MSLKELSKNTFILVLPKIVSFFLKIVRAKLSAIYLGAIGVGVLNQVSEIGNKLSSFSSLSLSVGAKKMIITLNKEAENRKEIPKVVGLYSLVLLVLVLLVFLVGLFFFSEMSEYFLKGQPKVYFLAAFLMFPLLTLISVPKVTLTSLMEFKTLSITEIIVAIIAFVFFIPLVIYFGIEGALINLVVTSIIAIVIVSYFTFKKVASKLGQPLITFKNLKVEKSNVKEFITISSIASLLGIYGILCELIIRGILASSLGMEQIGIYVPVIAWSGFFSSFFVPALIQYIFPKYGSCETNEELVAVANDGFRLTAFVIFPFVAIMIAFNALLIPLLYSDDFLEASVYLPLHFIGIFFWTWMRVLKQMLIPTGKVKQLIPFAFAESTLYLLVIFIFVDQIGLWSWTLRFSLVPLILLIAFYVYLSKGINMYLFRWNLFLMLYVVLASGFVYYITLKYQSNYFMQGGIVFLLIGMLYLFLRDSEKKAVYGILMKYLNKLK